MGKKARQTRELQRVAALLFNPNFARDVKDFQTQFKIPVGEGAIEWLFSTHLSKYDKSTFCNFVDNEKYPFLASKSVQSVLDTKIPFEQALLLLMESYGIPFNLFMPVLHFLLSNDRASLFYALVTQGFKVKIVDKLEHGMFDYKVTIDGLSPWMTKQDWVKIYENNINPYFESLRSIYKRNGESGPSKKRSSIKSYFGQMAMWSEWYTLSEVKGLGPAEALRIWWKNHQDKPCPDTSTVTHAIQEFREIITPQ